MKHACEKWKDQLLEAGLKGAAAKDLEDLVRACGARQTDDGGIRGGFIPVVHRFPERLSGAMTGRHGRLLDWRHGPIPFAHIGGLRTFELVDGPEDGQPTIGVGRGQTGQVGGVDHQDRVEFEADGARLDVAHSS